MWSMCNPKSEEDLRECAVLGKSLNRLSQPTILTILAENNEPMHGYIIVQKAAESPMFGGSKPDATGIYRALKRMEELGLVTSEWDTPRQGSAKRMFSLTDAGRRCLRRWIDALACYRLTLEELRIQASAALGIETPDTPVCVHVIPSTSEAEAEAAAEEPAEEPAEKKAKRTRKTTASKKTAAKSTRSRKKAAE